MSIQEIKFVVTNLSIAKFQAQMASLVKYYKLKKKKKDKKGTSPGCFFEASITLLQSLIKTVRKL